ncbi:hypothetical protein G6F42_013838 [Rhizopus arrhizus]|nr:hypothetical protein G6F42_013838 [Rhizopus arrhizus]
MTKDQSRVSSTTCSSSTPLATNNNSALLTSNTTTSAINIGYQFESGFCQYCGIDTFLFSHEFWCRFSTQ